MENTSANKELFFAHHWMQTFYTPNSQGQINYMIFTHWDDYRHKAYIPLISTKFISDEHAIEVAKIMGFGEYDLMNQLDKVISIVKRRLLAFNYNQDSFMAMSSIIGSNIIDFLRKNGYATPFMGLPVAKLQEYGWIKVVPTETK